MAARVSVRRGLSQAVIGDSFWGWYAFESEAPDYVFDGSDVSPMLLRWLAGVKRQIESRLEADADRFGTFLPDYIHIMRWDLFGIGTRTRDDETGEPDFSDAYEFKHYSSNLPPADGWASLEDTVRALGANEFDIGQNSMVGGSEIIAGVIHKIVIRFHTGDLREFPGDKDAAYDYFNNAQRQRNRDKTKARDQARKDREMADAIIEAAQKEAARILEEARNRAQAILDAAKKRSAEIEAKAAATIARAERKAERIISAAHEEAEALREGRKVSRVKKTPAKKPAKGTPKKRRKGGK